MIKRMYVIYDLVSKSVFSPVMCQDSDPLMIRDIKTSNLGNTIEGNLSDFDLIFIGELDTTKGEVVKTAHELVAHLDGIKVYGKGKE